MVVVGVDQCSTADLEIRSCKKLAELVKPSMKLIRCSRGCGSHLIRGPVRLRKPQPVVSQLFHELSSPSMFRKGRLAESENLPGCDPEGPNIRVDGEGQILQGLRSHPTPGKAYLI